MISDLDWIFVWGVAAVVALGEFVGFVFKMLNEAGN